MTYRRWTRLLTTTVLLGGLVCGAFAAGPADALRARHAALAPELSHNAFQRPLHIESTENSSELKGEVYAVVDHPFATVESSLSAVDPWCDILILHLNVKHCHAAGGPSNSTLAVSIGKKHDQPLSEAYRVNFHYQLASASPEYMKLLLSAPDGPLGTKDYRIVVEAVPIDAQRSFIHMSYAYGYGFAARIAMQGYLGTVGSGKVGFSVIDRRGDQPVYVGSVRGVIERNTMRYYLAIDAYLDSLAAPAAQRQERRLHEWFAATERYPKQLHEVDEADYMSMKRKEIQRQQADTQTAKAD